MQTNIYKQTNKQTNKQTHIGIGTVHTRYLGSKKPLGGFYHYINIGSYFLMLLDKYGIKLYILDVIFYQSVWCRG